MFNLAEKPAYMNEIALITGASAGFGEAIARSLAGEGYDLILCGRRLERLEKLASELGSGPGTDPARRIKCLAFDVRDPEAVDRALSGLDESWNRIDVLVNNAGLAAGFSHIHEGELDHWDRMIDTNLKGLLYMTRRITPGMVERKKGHVINIGSIAGKEAYERGNVYNATKFAVDGLTQAMRIDLVDFGIKVTVIHPGKAETEFSIVRYDGDKEKAAEEYRGFDPLLASDVADAVLYAASRPAHVNIDEMLIMGTAQARTRKITKKR